MLHNFRIQLFGILLLLIPVSIFANDEVTTINFDQVLQSNQIDVPIAAFTKKADYKKILNFETFDFNELFPSETKAEVDGDINGFNWKIVLSDNGKYELDWKEKKNFASVKYLAAYISVDRWMKGKLTVNGSHLLKVFVDGKSVGNKDVVEGDDDKSKGLSKEIKFETGKHLVIIKTVYDPANDNDWFVEAKMEVKEDYLTQINISTNPQKFMSVTELLDNPKVIGVAISGDGRYSAISISKRNKKKDADEAWLQIYNSQTGKLVNTFRGGNKIRSIKWSPDGRNFAYTTWKNGEGFLWIADFENGKVNPLLENVKSLGSFEWAPNSEYIIYTATEKGKAKDKDLKRYKKPQDRYPGYLNKSFVYKIDLETKLNYRITGGDESSYINSVSADGRWMVISKSKPNFDERPYSKTEYHLLDLVTMKIDSIASLNFGGSAKISPDASTILFLAGPSSFGDIGLDVKEGVIPNDYDTQAYLMNVATRKVTAISKDFNPRINDAYWTSDSKSIYFKTYDKSFSYLYNYNTINGIYSYVDLGVEYLKDISFASGVSIALYTGENSNKLRQAYLINFITGVKRVILDPDTESAKNLKLGEVKNWVFRSSKGKDIFGRVYYPPNFSPFKKYPAIIYYYAGTSPVTRDIGGRYPKNIWAANGYIVYVLQPSGAYGFGQEFSSTHVNDWGNTTAQEIIEGTEEFLKAHRFVDKKKIGCIGASYGGFETMNLITKTDMFTAAVSHAGISALTSYWGEGFWGVWYNSVAAANSFPWNRKDIYVDYSPIYNADKINTPLLLVHGDADTNVPPGESYQMYAALKLLKKDVELITVSDQDHHIMQYEKRKKWTKAIMAYFDKYLKNQPEWWNDTFGE